MTRITFTNLHTGKRETAVFISNKKVQAIFDQLPPECKAEIK
jgi:hypothetical protein